MAVVRQPSTNQVCHLGIGVNQGLESTYEQFNKSAKVNIKDSNIFNNKTALRQKTNYPMHFG